MTSPQTSDSVVRRSGGSSWVVIVVLLLVVAAAGTHFAYETLVPGNTAALPGTPTAAIPPPAQPDATVQTTTPAPPPSVASASPVAVPLVQPDVPAVPPPVPSTEAAAPTPSIVSASPAVVAQVQPDVPLAPPIAAPPADTARPAARVPAPRKSRPEPTTERLRGPEVRSVRLGMRLDEFKAALDGEIAEWRQSWRVENESDPYLRRQVNVRLADRSLLEAEFVSAIDGAELYVVSYQQVLRDGPTPDELIQALEAKYGKPDAINHPQGSTAYRSTYDLPSRAQHVLGAFMKVYFDFERAESGGRARVENFRIVINDAGFGAFDETAIYEHRRAAERRAYETNKSGAPKF